MRRGYRGSSEAQYREVDVRDNVENNFPNYSYKAGILYFKEGEKDEERRHVGIPSSKKLLSANDLYEIAVEIRRSGVAGKTPVEDISSGLAKRVERNYEENMKRIAGIFVIALMGAVLLLSGVNNMTGFVVADVFGGGAGMNILVVALLVAVIGFVVFKLLKKK